MKKRICVFKEESGISTHATIVLEGVVCSSMCAVESGCLVEMMNVNEDHDGVQLHQEGSGFVSNGHLVFL